ncbi:NADPH-dependent oxidoreductase [Candidatus Dependentiae bacterium]|nr:MAG: NADPH-dependent oxidoreductase [Candidatus Dependentiae bacterium]
MEVLLFAGSLQVGSLNKKLLRIVKKYLEDKKIKHTLIDLLDFAMPVYNQDIEKSTGIPATVQKLAEYIKDVEAIIIASPEYNGTISSPLKNTVDWLSRCKPMPLTDKQLLLLSTSPSQFGGVRGVWHTRVPFEMLGVHMYPTMFSLERGNMQFNEKGLLIDITVEKRLKKLIDAFIVHIQKFEKI